MIKRFEDWPTRLSEYLVCAETRAFSWADANCCLFACDGVAAMTGVNPADYFDLDHGDNKRSALAAVRRFAGGGVGAVADRIAGTLKVDRTAVAHARRGDVVLFKDGEIEALGLVDLTGRRIALMGPKIGFGFRPISEGVTAWRVG